LEWDSGAISWVVDRTSIGIKGGKKDDDASGLKAVYAGRVATMEEGY